MMVVRTLLAGLLLTAIIGWLIADHMILLGTGREIVVASKPVDSRELFRGDYVQLAYDFSALPVGAVDGGGKDPLGFDTSAIYVVLKPQGDHYVFDHASFTRPTVSADQLVLRGQVAGSGFVTPTGTLTPIFGIERYFVPEGKAQSLPSQMSGDHIDVVLVVDGAGNAAIKTLRIAGQDIYREGLF